MAAILTYPQRATRDAGSPYEAFRTQGEARA